jgi:hypothetical protein
MWSGNLGGHYGAYQPNFLRAYVFPLIAPGTDCPAGPPAVARGPASPAATLAASSPVINRAERLRVR